MDHEVKDTLTAVAQEFPLAVDLSPDESGPEPCYKLTTNGYDRLLRTQAALQFFAKGKHNPYLSDMSAAFLAEIERTLTEISPRDAIAS